MCIAKGIQKIMKTEIDSTTLQRTVDTESQTKTNNRLVNVKEVFLITDVEKLKHKHIFVIDDVVTTGPTLESCAHTLQQIRGIKVSIVTIAIA